MKHPLLAVALALGLAAPAAAQDRLLNVSYDISRELFEALNPAFAAHWQETTGRTVTIDMSHGGSSRQARAILEGLNADVVTFNQETDIDVLAEGGLLPANWRELLPNGASPYYSLPAFLVRAGNPLGIEDWDDLAREDVAPVFPNPKTSGNARYTYLAAYAYELARNAPPAEELSAELAALSAAVEADPDNHQARFDLAAAQIAAGERDGAADNLLAIIAADRGWNEGAARERLLALFEAVGLEDDWVKAQRRRLSDILFG